MFMTKKRKVYNAYLLMSDFIHENWQSLYEYVYDPDNEHASLCCICAVCLYVSFHLKDYNYPLDMYKCNFADHPDYVNELEAAYARFFKYASSEAAASCHQKIAKPDEERRMRQDPRNAIYDCYYGKIAYAMVRYTSFYEFRWSSNLTMYDFMDLVYDFFVSNEPSVKQLVAQVNALIG
jgi:hypothetical protein